MERSSYLRTGAPTQLMNALDECVRAINNLFRFVKMQAHRVNCLLS